MEFLGGGGGGGRGECRQDKTRQVCDETAAAGIMDGVFYLHTYLF